MGSSKTSDKEYHDPGITTPNAVDIDGVSKLYGSVRALSQVNLRVERGEFVVVLGPSGCGKSTLLRTVAGLDRPDAGEVSLGGRVVSSHTSRVYVAPDKRNVGMVFQNYALWPHLTVSQNVRYPLRARRCDTPENVADAAKLLDAVGLASMSERYPGQLSGGQQQRVAFVRALVGSPSAVLFDEPLSNLDTKLRLQLRDQLRDLRQLRQFTGLYVTHDIGEALALGSRIVVMNQGTIEQVGAPEEIFKKPATAFVAEFIGYSTLLRGAVAGFDTDSVSIECEILGRVTTSSTPGESWTKGQRCLVAVRPRGILVSADRTTGVPGRMVDSRFHGDVFVGQVEIAGRRLSVESNAPLPHPGSDVRVKLAPQSEGWALVRSEN